MQAGPTQFRSHRFAFQLMGRGPLKSTARLSACLLGKPYLITGRVQQGRRFLAANLGLTRSRYSSCWVKWSRQPKPLLCLAPPCRGGVSGSRASLRAALIVLAVLPGQIKAYKFSRRLPAFEWDNILSSKVLLLEEHTDYFCLSQPVLSC